MVSETASIFAKQGYNRKTCRKLLYGPSDYGGGGHIRWQWLQGAQQITNFLKYWRTDGCVSDSLRVAVSWMQQNAGVGFSLLADPSSPVPYLEGRWLKSLRRFLSSIDGAIHIDNTFVPTIQRYDDKHLMDIALASGFNDKELSQINYCRLYMNVVTISDLCEPDGLHIAKGAFVGAVEFLPSSSSDIPTEQARPNGSSWHKWRLLLDLIASSNTHLLHLPLGSWLQGGDSLRRQWTSYYDPATRCLYRRIQDKFLRYEQMDSRFINGVLETWTPSSTSFPVSPLLLTSDIWTIPQLEQTYLSTASLHHAGPTSPPSIAPDFYTFIRQETGPYDYLKENIHMFLEPNEIFHLVETESADDLNSDPPYHLILCSDGSDLIPLMSYGWIFATSLGTKLAQGNGPAFGFHSSHRAEGTGMLSGAVFIQLLVTSSPSRDLEVMLQRNNSLSNEEPCFLAQYPSH